MSTARTHHYRLKRYLFKAIVIHYHDLYRFHYFVSLINIDQNISNHISISYFIHACENVTRNWPRIKKRLQKKLLHAVIVIIQEVMKIREKTQLQKTIPERSIIPIISRIIYETQAPQFKLLNLTRQKRAFKIWCRWNLNCPIRLILDDENLEYNMKIYMTGKPRSTKIRMN